MKKTLKTIAFTALVLMSLGFVASCNTQTSTPSTPELEDYVTDAQKKELTKADKVFAEGSDETKAAWSELKTAAAEMLKFKKDNTPSEEEQNKLKKNMGIFIDALKKDPIAEELGTIFEKVEKAKTADEMKALFDQADNLIKTKGSDGTKTAWSNVSAFYKDNISLMFKGKELYNNFEKAAEKLTTAIAKEDSGKKEKMLAALAELVKVMDD